MTYNFDPDRWFDNERLRLDARERSENLTVEEKEKALADIERRYEEMLARLDGTFPVAGRSVGDS